MSLVNLWFLFFAAITATISSQINPITYAYKTEVNINNKLDFELPQELEWLAEKCYQQLNTSLFFNATFIQRPKEVRQWHKDRMGAHFFNVTTEDGVIIPCTFFDRNSDHLIIIGSGFTNNREIMSPFIAMFEDSDIVLFDFRGHGYDEDNPPSCLTSSLSRYLFDADAHIATLGKKEELDVLAVINHIKKFRNNPAYKVYGVGICYAALIFLKTAALYPNTFNKLILDGCWLSLKNFVEKLKKDPRLICIPQEGGWKNNWLCRLKTTQSLIELLAMYVFGFDLTDISLANIIKKNKSNLQQLPILFFHGKNDLMVLRSEFETFWNALPTPNKIAIITSNPHIKNHWKQKELYTLLCKLFISQSPQDFTQSLATPALACNYLLETIHAKLSPLIHNPAPPKTN